MLISKLVVFFLHLLRVRFTASEDVGFIYSGFRATNLSLDGIADITSNGPLMLTNDTKQQTGHAFYSHPVPFKNSPNGNAFSFSTIFVFAIISQYQQHISGQGIAFVISPTLGLPGARPSQYLGLFNESNNGDSSNHIVDIEIDTIQSREFGDIDDNHVGIDINGLNSEKSASAGYFTGNDDEFKNLSLISGLPMQVWVDYDGVLKQLNVTLAPLKVPKPNIPLLSLSYDLSKIFFDFMYVVFSWSTGSLLTSQYLLGWSFKLNGKAQPLDPSQLPKLPLIGTKKKSKIMTTGMPIIITTLVLTAISGIIYMVRRKRKFAEVLEDWELVYGSHRYKYKDLYIATKGFSEKELLGIGGFGRVYRGKLPTSKIEVAVKRVSHESRQGIKEFVAEIASVGRLRHRNLVRLLGYCRRKGELLLVYDFMPNRSLDKFLFDKPKFILTWSQRFRIIKGVASGLFYLHEEWEQVVVHRDVKSSNVLLDGELNARLGDFGLARLYDHGSNPQTTHVAGTLGYLAPELTRTGKATTSTDVFAFGVFLLEVACGRRPIGLPVSGAEDLNLVDWVFTCWKRGEILNSRDPNLGTDYVKEEMELVLKLGLLCSHSLPTGRPSMRQVLQYLNGDLPLPLPELASLATGDSVLTFGHLEGFDEVIQLSSVAESVLSEGR